MLKKLILILGVLSLTACAFDQDTSKSDAKEAEERARLLSKYNSVVGTYAGKLSTGNSEKDIELTLFTLEEVDSQNQNGEDTNRVVLRANYKAINPASAGLNLRVRYIPETSELIFTNENKTPGPDDVHTINAKIAGNTIEGQVKSLSGLVGVLKVSLQSAERQKPGSDNQEHEYYERLREQYEAIAGTYTGANIKGGKATFTFTITLQVVKEGKVPKLIGRFDRADDPAGSVSLYLKVNYQTDLNPPVLTITGTSIQHSSDYLATFDGTLVNGEYKGSWQNNKQGFQGDFTLKKVQ
ncbi:hypothetical protein [Bdellovibrio reynosensis]|uniref:Lipoprotein n=1 Tax=Bdellovibrio reynosensis TaxID=2835041 RepID=A0ABY4CG32_9BACT|nr:hypothetical protein [Bdellovibrio reynosensis]UOF02837.1 hypothetical protein MNR06_07710 [Bdellovibrio reynosensis]